MAPRRNDKRRLQRNIEQTSDRAIRYACLAALVVCLLINAVYEGSVPELILFGLLGGAIGPEAVNFIRNGGRKG